MLPNIGFTEYQCGVLELSEASSHTVIELTDHVLAAQIALDAIEASGIERASHLAFELLLDDGCETVEFTTNQRAAVRDNMPQRMGKNVSF